MAGVVAAMLDAIARDLRLHHVGIVTALSLAEGAILTTIEPAMLPGAQYGARHTFWLCSG